MDHTLTLRRMGRAAAALLTAALLLSGCSGDRGSSSAGGGSHIAYPDLLPESYAGSELEVRAEQYDALICGVGDDRLSTADGATDGSHVRQTVADFLDRTTGDLYVLSLWGDDRQFGTHFFYDEDGQLSATTPWELLPEEYSQEEAHTNPVYGLELNEYGYLVYREGGPDFEPSSYKLINERELYPDTARRDELYETYFSPIAYTALTGKSWESIEELNILWLYEDLLGYEGRSAGDGVWQISDMAATLSRYFDGITEERLTALAEQWNSGSVQVYYPEDGTVRYQGGRGGGPLCLRITDWTEEGDLLSLHYVSYDYTTGVPNPDSGYVLTVENRPDGSFCYRSNLPDNK